MVDLSNMYDEQRSMNQATFLGWLSHAFDLTTPIAHCTEDAIFFNLYYDPRMSRDELSTFVTNGCQFEENGQLFMIIL